MALGKINPARLDRQGTMYSKNESKTTLGEDNSSPTADYTFKFALMAPLRGAEGFNGQQPVSEQKYGVLIRKEDRTITPSENYFISESVTYQIVSVRPWMESRKFQVLDCIVKDKA